MIEVWAVGGYTEIGKNMTAVRVGNEVIIFDMGASMDRMVALEAKGIEEPTKLGAKDLISAGVIPNDYEMQKEWGKKVKAIIISHAHLDHLWAAIKLAEKYNCPLLMTPFTAEVLDNILKNEKVQFSSKIIKMNAGSSYKISDSTTIEFIYATHSTPQSVITVLHTAEGKVMYTGDWKFDEYPALGKRTDYDRLKQLGREGIDIMICDSTRVDEEKRTFSESLVKEMFKDIFLWTENTNNAIFVATFASHISRINTLVSMAEELKRKPLILGRSMINYVSAAERTGIIDISRKAKIYSYKRQIAKALKDVEKKREKYFVICTGCQGEPHSVLSRISNNLFKFKFQPEDQVIFAASVIPTEINRVNRTELELKLKGKSVRLFTDIHVSGHAAREDVRDMLKMVKPKHYLPTHGSIDKIAAGLELAKEMGYIMGKTMHSLQEGQRLVLK
jgi:ribonuclease J